MSTKITNSLIRAIANKYVNILKNSILGKKWEFSIEEDWADAHENSWESEGKNDLRVKIFIKRIKERAPGQEKYKIKTKAKEDYRLMTLAFEGNRVRHWSSNKREDSIYCYIWDRTSIEINYPAFLKFAWTAFLLMFKNLPDNCKIINSNSGEIKLFSLQLLLPMFLTIDQLAEPENLAEMI